MFKKCDAVLIVFLIVLSVLSGVLFFNSGSVGKTVVVSINNSVYAEYPLYENRTVELKNNGYNKLIIKNGTAYVEKADCKDKICVKHKKISKRGETIICLPHKTVIEVK